MTDDYYELEDAYFDSIRRKYEVRKQLNEAEEVLKKILNTQYENFMKAPLNAIPNDNIQEIQNYFDKYYGEIK